jgi:peptidoglycan/LPS O-acetylase OafA/YrhL
VSAAQLLSAPALARVRVQGSRIVELDGLRAFAIIPVIPHHICSLVPTDYHHYLAVTLPEVRLALTALTFSTSCLMRLFPESAT